MECALSRLFKISVPESGREENFGRYDIGIDDPLGRGSRLIAAADGAVTSAGCRRLDSRKPLSRQKKFCKVTARN